MKYSWLLVVSCWLLAFNAEARMVVSDWAESDNVRARIVADNLKFGVEIKADQGWHTYYKDPGEAGYPTEFDWSGSEDFEVIEERFPPYKVIDEYGIKTNGYYDGVFIDVSAKLGDNPLAKLNLTGAVCNEICVPYNLNLELDLGKNPPSTTPSGRGDYEKVLPPEGGVRGGLASVIWTAFLAGLILNIMPCVLPVLSLKVLSVVKQAGKERAHARMNFMMTSFGIISSFLVLAGGTAILKSLGHSLGWGLHFQSPLFVGFLTLVTFLFALSLFGIFHLRVPSWISDQGPHQDSLVGNFVAGVLATLLGTACTAPVLVTAVTFALAGGYFDIFLVFIVMGIGMALPYLLFAFNPSLANFLPKPGKWMEIAKNIFGIMLLLTSIWLGSVLYNQLSDSKIMPAQEITESDELIWYEFDEEMAASQVAKGKVVFVDLTAKWCVTCQANKIRVLSTKEIEELFSDKDIVTMRGDMTKETVRTKELKAYMKKYERYGIPFNIVYGPNAKEGVVLEPLLTKDAVKQAVKEAR